MQRQSNDPPQDQASRARGTKETELSKHILAADHVILGTGAVGMVMAMAMADMLVAETSAEAIMSSGIEAVVEGEPW